MTRLIITLGNYNKKYQRTFHNVALDFLSFFIKYSKTKFQIQKQKNYILLLNKKNKNKILIPKFNMNENFIAYEEFRKKFGKHKVFLMFDDVNINIGTCKFNPVKGNVTHNGVKPFIEKLNNFCRVRIGIKTHYTSNYSLRDYVLRNIDNMEYNKLIYLYNNTLSKIVNNILENKKEEEIIELINLNMQLTKTEKKFSHLIKDVS